MLILTRFRGESIKIGTEVTVKVLKVRAGYILIGIEAPQNVRILRREICEKCQPQPGPYRVPSTGTSASR